ADVARSAGAAPRRRGPRRDGRPARGGEPRRHAERSRLGDPRALDPAPRPARRRASGVGDRAQRSHGSRPGGRDGRGGGAGAPRELGTLRQIALRRSALGRQGFLRNSSKKRLAVGPRWPWYLLFTVPDPYGRSAAVESRKKLICPIFIPG